MSTHPLAVCERLRCPGCPTGHCRLCAPCAAPGSACDGCQDLGAIALGLERAVGDLQRQVAALQEAKTILTVALERAEHTAMKPQRLAAPTPESPHD